VRAIKGDALVTSAARTTAMVARMRAICIERAVVAEGGGVVSKGAARATKPSQKSTCGLKRGRAGEASRVNGF
jgi:hypothetical protein